MEKIKFTKMQAAGNDFIVIDDRIGRIGSIPADVAARLCARRRGIGADGILLLQSEEGYDFRMKYINADGSEGEMCGNGARCLVLFAHSLSGSSRFEFIAGDGEHSGWIDEGIVFVTVRADSKPQELSVEGRTGFFVDTGVPHFVTELTRGDESELDSTGRAVRSSDVFQPEGVNVDFIEETPEGIVVRTYERGVEAETHACGTGAVAVALSMQKSGRGDFPYKLLFQGGTLVIDKGATNGEFVLTGPTEKVYEGFLCL